MVSQYLCASSGFSAGIRQLLFDELGEHLSTTIPLMTTFPQLISLLATRPSPQMTIYSQERVEFNGPVIARWFAKVANLLGSDLAPNLFDGPFGFETPSTVSSDSNNETRQTLCLAVGPWQKLTWSVFGGRACCASGGTIRRSGDGGSELTDRRA